MVAEWREVPLGELAEIFDGPHATPQKTTDGPIFLGISNLSNGRLDLSQVEHLSNDDFGRWTRRVAPRQGDIVFSYETRLGEVAVIPGNLRCCLGRRMGLLRARPGKVDGRFLLYAYMAPEFQATLRARTIHGSTVDRIPLIDLPDFPIRIPVDIAEQAVIGRILGSLDDKIELNRRMAETLEAMARALFKSWFVDFDPVRAKAEGRRTNLSEGIADLFPSSLENNDLPTGWHREPLREHFDVFSGGTPSKGDSRYWGGEIPWVTPRSMMQSHVFDTEDRVTRAAVGNGTRLVPGGSIMVMVRGMGLHQDVRISQAHRDVTFNQDVKALVARKLDSAFLLYFMLDRRETLLAKVCASGHGTGVLPSDALEGLLIPVPPAPVQQRLFEPFMLFNARIALSRLEARTLASLRDALLPKLVSGELRIADAEKRIAAA